MKHVAPASAKNGRFKLQIIVALVAFGIAFVMAEIGYVYAALRFSVAKGEANRREWLAAIESLDVVLRADPYASAEANLLRSTAINSALDEGVDLGGRRNRQDALRDLDQCLAIKPDWGEALYQRGCTLASLRRRTEAREALERAIPQLADPGDALILLSDLARDDSDFAAAEKLITRAIEIRPLAPELYEKRAFLRTFLRDFHGRYLDEARALKLTERPIFASLEEVEASERDSSNRPVSANQNTPAVRAALASLEGDWLVVDKETSKPEDPNAPRQTLVMQFHGGKLTLVRVGESDPFATYVVEPDETDRRIRIDIKRKIDGRETTMRGLYSVNDNVLRLFLADEGGPRPTGFTAKGQFGVAIYTMKPASQGRPAIKAPRSLDPDAAGREDLRHYQRSRTGREPYGSQMADSIE